MNKYAPVIIPTLNRFTHFKNCLESLERCSWADNTDVYVGLDFPPSEKYIEGWQKINQYLYNKEKSHCFKNLIVFRHDHNLGVMSIDSNITFLIDYVSNIYDRYIFSEDDNVFSPNFLEYINKGLDKYENDDSVFAIVGYAHPYHFKHGDNNHYRHQTDMSAWGYGTWVNKWKVFISYVENGGFNGEFSIRNMIKSKKHGWLRLFDYLHYSYHKGFVRITDGVMTTYLIVKDRCVICPTLSKVKNIGWDGSGNSSNYAKSMKDYERIAHSHLVQEFDQDEHFVFFGDDTAYMDYNNKVAVRESDCSISFWKFVVKIFKSL